MRGGHSWIKTFVDQAGKGTTAYLHRRTLEITTEKPLVFGRFDIPDPRTRKRLQRKAIADREEMNEVEAAHVIQRFLRPLILVDARGFFPMQAEIIDDVAHSRHHVLLARRHKLPAKRDEAAKVLQGWGRRLIYGRYPRARRQTIWGAYRPRLCLKEHFRIEVGKRSAFARARILERAAAAKREVERKRKAKERADALAERFGRRWLMSGVGAQARREAMSKEIEGIEASIEKTNTTLSQANAARDAAQEVSRIRRPRPCLPHPDPTSHLSP